MAKVCLDAGHGGTDSGAAALGRKEKDDVLRLVLRVGQMLSANGVEVFYNRTTDIFENVNTKARKANGAKVDFFASFHRNAANGKAKGSETLVYSNTGKAKVCADRANQKMQECGFTQRGAKVRTDLAVLNSTKMPAVLFETGFIDNATDNQIFDSQFEKIAQGYAEAVAVAVGVEINSSGAPTENEVQEIYYRGHVQGIGATEVVHDGMTCGTIGLGRRLEGFFVDCRKVQGMELDAELHMQGVGWVKYDNVQHDTLLGTVGESRRIEALRLTGKNIPGNRKLVFRIHIQDIAWSEWTQGQLGTVGLGKRIEAIQIKLQ